jgi:hypothetical protein
VRILDRRSAAAILLLLAGVGMVVYGAAFHSLPLRVEEEREYEVLVPGPILPFGPPSGPPEALPAPGPSDNPFETPGAGRPADKMSANENPFEPSPQSPQDSQGTLPPGLVTKKITERVVSDEWMPEWVVVREVTFGGVARLENGQLKRTYSGKPPALCPT